MSRIALISLVLVSCGQGAESKDPPANAGPAPATPTATPAATPAAPEPVAPAPPAADTGFCEYTVDGGAPNRGGGGIMNVQSKHWISDKGKDFASALLINCGSGKQINIGHGGEVLPLGPATYKIVRMVEDKAAFGVIGPDFLSGEGELVLTAFDTAHVAGSFDFKAGGKSYKGTFDLKCPQPGNGICP